MVRLLDNCAASLHDEETSQDQLPSIDSRSSVSSNSLIVSPFNLSSPNDKDMNKREELLSYQNHNRGVGASKVNVQTLPVISYRLRKLPDTVSDRKDVMAGWSHDVKPLSSGQALMFPKVSSSFDGRSNDLSDLGIRLAHGTLASTKKNKGIFHSNNAGIMVSQKMTLTERENKPVEKLAIPQHHIHTGLRIKGVWSSFELQGRVTKKSRTGVYKSQPIPADRIGSTTKYNKMPGTPRTLADVLKNSEIKFQGSSSVCSERRSNGVTNSQTVADQVNMEWHSKLNTRLIDDHGYDIFARTERTPD